jgi:hypothetical protein
MIYSIDKMLMYINAQSSFFLDFFFKIESYLFYRINNIYQNLIIFIVNENVLSEV